MAIKDPTKNMYTNGTLSTLRALLWRNTRGHKNFAALVLPDKSSTELSLYRTLCLNVQFSRTEVQDPPSSTSFLTSRCCWVPEPWPSVISTYIIFWSYVMQAPCFWWVSSFYYTSCWATDSYASHSLLCIYPGLSKGLVYLMSWESKLVFRSKSLTVCLYKPVLTSFPKCFLLGMGTMPLGVPNWTLRKSSGFCSPPHAWHPSPLYCNTFFSMLCPTFYLSRTPMSQELPFTSNILHLY